MIIEESFRLAAPREAVASFLVDIERMSRCVPGVEGVVAVGNGEYRATLRAQLGPMAAAFQGSMRLDDSQAPARLMASGEGHDQRSGSRAKVEFTADLEDEGEETLVRARADMVIRGRLGQFGTGVINSTAREMIREFAECVDASLSQSGGGAEPASAELSSLIGIASRGLWSWLAGLARSARQRLARLFRSQGRT